MPGESALAAPYEVLVLALSGSAVVEAEREQFALAGRPDVFGGISDYVYLPRDSELTLRSEGGGTGSYSRQVVNLATPGVFDADGLIVCAVCTPAGNWSSFPPHKHDEEREGETALEEIYYLAVAAGPPGVGGRVPAGVRQAGAPDRRAGGGPHRRRRADPPRLARTVDGDARLRPVLPQRDGRAGRRSGVADLLLDHRWVMETLAEPVDTRLPLVRAQGSDDA